MKKFFQHIFLMVLAIALTFCPVFASGEMVPIHYVINRQMNGKKNILFGLGYTNRDAYFKTQMTICRDPEILALGSSRVLQIRKSFFQYPDTFYNAGLAARDAAEMQCFLEQLPETNHLKIVIISIDQWSYNYNYTGELYDPDSSCFVDFSLNKTLDFKNTMTKIINDYVDQKLNILQLIQNNDRIGVNAKVNKEGFLNDGSYYYGRRFAEKDAPNESWFSDTFQRIENGERRFEYGEKVNEEALLQMESFLKYCKQNKIYVIGFEPPFSASVFQRMQEKEAEYKYLSEIPLKMKTLFERYQFEFYDYSDIRNLSCGSDSYFIDGFHGSDVVYIRMFQDMIRQGSKLGTYCDEEQLRDLDMNRDSDVAIYRTLDEY